MADNKYGNGYYEEVQKVMDILEKNEHLDFVRRIFNPEMLPHLTTKDGKPATHQMGWGDSHDENGIKRYWVYPNIVNIGGKLVWLKGGDAFKYARDTGEWIEVGSAEEADWLSKQYKLIWPEDKR